MKGLEVTLFEFAPLPESSKTVRVSINAFHFKISFNLMLAAALLCQSLRSTKVVIIIFCAVGIKSLNHK